MAEPKRPPDNKKTEPEAARDLTDTQRDTTMTFLPGTPELHTAIKEFGLATALTLGATVTFLVFMEAAVRLLG